jgi:hypothetical protein
VDDECCDETTCRLISPCTCATCNHACCSSQGLLETPGVICRPSADDSPDSDCDEVETCDGTSPYCPVDRRAKTGTACSANKGRCYSGDCRIGWPRVSKTSYMWVAAPCDDRYNSSHVVCRDADSGEPASGDDASSSSPCSALPRPPLSCCNPPLPFDPSLTLSLSPTLTPLASFRHFLLLLGWFVLS